MTKKVYIEGMSCEHCAKRVEKALLAVTGIHTAQVDLDKKVAMIEVVDILDEAKIKEAVSEAGYTVTRIE